MSDWFMAAASGIVAIMAGFWIGRWSTPLEEGILQEEGENGGDSSPRGERPGQRISGERPGQRISGKGSGQRISGERPGQRISGERSEQRISGERPGQRISGERPGQRVSGERSGREESRWVRGRGRRDRGIYLENGKKHIGREKRIPLGWAIGSPVEGQVSTFYEGSRKGALIDSDKGQVYAPASGKITRLYPIGNRMTLCTDSGVELLLQVGGPLDELCSVYFRPRVVQNEIVGKGKLLLEYDRDGLLGEGADTGVSISVEAAEDMSNITVTGQESVKVGEALLWVREYL